MNALYIAYNIHVFLWLANFLFVKGRGDEPIGLFFIHLCDIPCGDAFPAAGAEDRPVVLGKVEAADDDSVVIHLHKIALANFLVMGDEALAIRAADL